MIRLEPGDCLEVIPRLVAEGVVVDAVVCDPPYDLTATAKRFGKAGSAPAQYGRDGAMARLSGGFMNCQWDSTGIAFRPETWATVATVMRPGSFLLAFGGTRTFHRMVCAIEDAGFVIQDTIMWMYATGFPKRRDALKPAYEPIVVAYKPGGKRTLQVGECRIPTGASPSIQLREAARRSGNAPGRPGEYGHTIVNRITKEVYCAEHPGEEAGRWPANVIHDSSDEVMDAFAAFGEHKGGISVSKNRDGLAHNSIYGPMRKMPREDCGYNDTGTAARFFMSAKAGAEDRWGSRHPTVKPTSLITYLVKLVCPSGGTFLDPFAGSGTAAVAALASGRNAILIEREPQYIADIRERIAHYEGKGRHSLAAKARNRKPTGDGPLFGEAAE